MVRFQFFFDVVQQVTLGTGVEKQTGFIEQ